MVARLSRDQKWEQLDANWDLVVIGGGITGAGIVREATHMGYRTLLVEAGDFASGTSSRSSKLVHGGFRYLKNGQMRLTYQSVRERERLLREGRGLVNRLGFLLATFDGDRIPAWVFEAGLSVYDLLAFQWGHRRYDTYDMRDLCPLLTEDGLQGGFRYFDAQTDDARLVLRLIQEAERGGACAINYARAAGLLTTRDGLVRGVALEDRAPETAGRTAEVEAAVVINATGAWADELRRLVGGGRRLRQLRGSHLIFSGQLAPLTRAVSFLHPRDARPVFAIPWEGVTLFGTTDVDLSSPLDCEPAISRLETEYLMEAARYAFPCLNLSASDIQATFAGVRPVVDTGKRDPSKESREHVLWQENRLITVAGGKLTTFRLMARDALHKAGAFIKPRNGVHLHERLLDAQPDGIELPEELSTAARVRLLGRYGAAISELLQAAEQGEMQPVAESSTLWSELRWAARAEVVIHLDDLLLRRSRLGLQLPSGGLGILEDVRRIAQPELGWDDDRWQREARNYTDLWKKCYHWDN